MKSFAKAAGGRKTKKATGPHNATAPIESGSFRENAGSACLCCFAVLLLCCSAALLLCCSAALLLCYFATLPPVCVPPCVLRVLCCCLLLPLGQSAAGTRAQRTPSVWETPCQLLQIQLTNAPIKLRFSSAHFRFNWS
jgi:hypothetical protein